MSSLASIFLLVGGFLLSWWYVPIMLTFAAMCAILSAFLGGGSVASWWGYEDSFSSVFSLLAALVGLGALMCTSEFDPVISVVVILSTASSVIFFLSDNLFLFFFFFEAGVIPLIILIMGWGHQPERLQACVSFVVYTMMGSLPMFIVLCWSSFVYNTSNMSVISVLHQNYNGSNLFWCMIYICFLINIPVFGVHGWLPNAHVEAPVAGSMILAGVLLKFGGYGIIRVMKCFSWDESLLLSDLLTSVGLWGAFCSAIVCVVQVDINSLIAYSSISHIGFVVVGIFSGSALGWFGAMIIMVGHGVSSPLLFALANYTYNLFHSRNIILCKGLILIYPNIAALWFLGCGASMGLPPGVLFFSEVCFLSVGLSISWVMLVPMTLTCLASSAYSLYLYTSVNHGGVSKLSLSSGSSVSGLSLIFIIIGVYIIVSFSVIIECFC